MTKILLNRKYYRFIDSQSTEIDEVVAEFKSAGLFIRQTGGFGGSILINKRGQKILYEEFKKRFEK